jgi:hypothetical protein
LASDSRRGKLAAQDDFSDYYLVSPISAELLVLILEDWTVWMRWIAAFGRGETTMDTHPALPADRRTVKDRC